MKAEFKFHRSADGEMWRTCNEPFAELCAEDFEDLFSEKLPNHVILRLSDEVRRPCPESIRITSP